MTCPYCHGSGRRWLSCKWPHRVVECNHQPAETPKEERMKFEVELIDNDRCLIPGEGIMGMIVADDDLGATLRSIKDAGKKPAPKKSRTRRTKEQVAAAKAAKEAKGNPEA